MNDDQPTVVMPVTATAELTGEHTVVGTISQHNRTAWKRLGDNSAEQVLVLVTACLLLICVIAALTVTALVTDSVTNKRRYASRTVRTGKREAQRVLNEMISESERGLSVRTSVTVGDLLERWFDLAARGFSPTTVKERRGNEFDFGQLSSRIEMTADHDALAGSMRSK